MAYLLDTTILLRLTNEADVQYTVAVHAVNVLHKRGEVLHLTAQNLVEFRHAATRPKNVNGLGLSAADADYRTVGHEVVFPFLPETPDIYPAWKAIVSALGIIGKQVHDARLVAVCHVHQVTHLLTFNTVDFAWLARYGPGVVVVDPASV